MTEINPNNYSNIRLTRDMKADYAKGDPVINTVFKKYDTDLSGDFNEKEWENYSKDVLMHEENRRTLLNSNDTAVNFYRNKQKRLSQTIQVLDKTWVLLDKEHEESGGYFNKLLEFEEKYEIDRQGYIKESEVPKGAYKVDIAAIGMGIFDKEKMSFTGECYEKGYIVGLEKLSEEERKEYLDLLEKSLDYAERCENHNKKFEAANKEMTRYMKLIDLANNGYINGVISQEAEQKLLEIYDAANPFLKEIQELQAEKERIFLKWPRTEEDEKRTNEIFNQLNKLYEASFNWSVSELDRAEFEKHLQKEGFSGSATPIEVTLNPEDQSIKYTSNLGFNYKDNNWNIQGAYSNILNVGRKGDKIGLNVTNIGSLGVQYSVQDLILTSQSNIYNQEKMTTASQTFGVSIKGFNAQIGEEIRAVDKELENNSFMMENNTNNPESKKVSYTTNANVGYNYQNLSVNVSGSITPKKVEAESENSFSDQQIEGYTVKAEMEKGLSDQQIIDYSVSGEVGYKIGAFDNKARITNNLHGTETSLSSTATFGKEKGNWSFNVTPSVEAKYNTNGKFVNVPLSLDGGIRYQKDDLGIGLHLYEGFDATFAKEMPSTFNSNFTANGSVAYKGLQASIKYNNSYNESYNDSRLSVDKTNTYGIELAYNLKKYGKISLEGSLSSTQNKQEDLSGQNSMENACMVPIKQQEQKVNEPQNNASITVKYSLKF